MPKLRRLCLKLSYKRTYLGPWALQGFFNEGFQISSKGLIILIYASKVPKYLLSIGNAPKLNGLRTLLYKLTDSVETLKSVTMQSWVQGDMSQNVFHLPQYEIP